MRTWLAVLSKNHWLRIPIDRNTQWADCVLLILTCTDTDMCVYIYIYKYRYQSMWRWNIAISDDLVYYFGIVAFLQQSMTCAFNRTNKYTSMFLSNYVLDWTEFNLPVLQQWYPITHLLFVTYVHVRIVGRAVIIIYYEWLWSQLIRIKIPCWWTCFLITPTTSPSISNYELSAWLFWLYHHLSWLNVQI